MGKLKTCPCKYVETFEYRKEQYPNGDRCYRVFYKGDFIGSINIQPDGRFLTGQRRKSVATLKEATEQILCSMLNDYRIAIEKTTRAIGQLGEFWNRRTDGKEEK